MPARVRIAVTAYVSDGDQKGGLWIAGTTRPPALTANARRDQSKPALEFPARRRRRDRGTPGFTAGPLSTFLCGRRRDRARNPRLHRPGVFSFASCFNLFLNHAPRRIAHPVRHPRADAFDRVRAMRSARALQCPTAHRRASRRRQADRAARDPRQLREGALSQRLRPMQSQVRGLQLPSLTLPQPLRAYLSGRRPTFVDSDHRLGLRQRRTQRR